MNTETITPNAAGPPDGNAFTQCLAAPFDGTSNVSNLVIEAAVKVGEAVLIDHAAVEE